ncbi:hypothetical protein Tco_1357517 [Tanacetum coccineum]
MATMVENVIAAGSENRPSILEKGMYDSWKTRIILYIRGKEKGEMLKESIDKGPFQLKPKITAKDKNGPTDILCSQTVEDLTLHEKLRYNSDIKAVNILLLRLPDFLADSLEETDDCKDLQLQATTNYKADHVDTYDSYCDEEATANAIFMESLSPIGSINDDTVETHYDSDILF